MERQTVILVCLVLVLFGQISTTASQEATGPSVLLNVVLIEIGGDTQAVKGNAVRAGDWAYWEKAAPRLLYYLEQRLGRVRATGETPRSEASLYAVRCAAHGLGDNPVLADLTKYLDHVCETTKRPSFLVVWLSDEQQVLAGWQDRDRSQAESALALLERIQMTDASNIGMSQNQFVAPPCILASSSCRMQTKLANAKLDDLLQENGIRCVLHNAATMETVLALAGVFQDFLLNVPAGTSIEVVTANLDKINVFCWGTVGAMVAGEEGRVIAGNAALLAADFGRQITYPMFESKLMQPVAANTLQAYDDLRLNAYRAGVAMKPISDVYGPVFLQKIGVPREVIAQQDATTAQLNLWLGKVPQTALPQTDLKILPYEQKYFGGPNWPNGGGGGAIPKLDVMSKMTVPHPGGILFYPELEVVADATGMTASTAKKAIAAVKGKVSGTFRDEKGREIIVVAAPGTKGLFQVNAGRFHLKQQDLCLRVSTEPGLELNRYYDSGDTGQSVLGKGWTFLPFSLCVGQTAKSGKAMIEFAKKPVLIDNERGIEMTYQAEFSEDNASIPSGGDLPRYRAAGSSFQPYLSARPTGGYTATFAHGLQASFNADGRLEWMGTSESNKVAYVFASERLTEIVGLGGKILLCYDQNGRLYEAVGPDGKRVEYVIDNSRGLTEVSGAMDGAFVFGYGEDNRLKTVETTTETFLVQNSYDSKGRMLSHETPSGHWTFRYDDNVGCVVIADHSGKELSYYYNGRQQLVAYGGNSKEMTLFNYDMAGRIFEVAVGELLNDPSTGGRPRFKITKMIMPTTTGEKKPAKKG